MNTSRVMGLGVAIVFITLFLSAVLNLVFALIAQSCWNYFCEALHLPPLGYWQMWAVLMFLSIIAGIFRNNVEIKKD